MKRDVAPWYAYDDAFVTIVGEVEEPGGDVYTLLYHPYHTLQDSRSDLCGATNPQLMQMVSEEGVPLRADVDWDTYTHNVGHCYLLLATPEEPSEPSEPRDSESHCRRAA